MRRSLLVLSLLAASTTLTAQSKQRTTAEQVWVGYFNQTRLTDKWGLWFDGQLRTRENFIDHLSQGIARAGLTYYLSDALKATAGYAYIHHYPADDHKEVAMPEHRPWQQLQLHTKYGRLRTMQLIRLEERYRRRIANDSLLAPGYNFNYRLRYSFLLQVPLTRGEIKKGAVSFIANNEVHINFGKRIVYNYFDQNRFFLGAAYHLNAHDNLQVGYMNVFQQLGAGNRYRTLHTPRLFYFHNLDLRSKRSGG